ncbi:MAG: TlpA family protein disulfide reductase [Saprospiraceae bacterium]|nr:TlpA family protein disulfide reductase [Saprospiraceae bacterium]MBP7699570.1 TlpA family protein disulfide reductase [Saprospiraceae bacterium]
MTIKSGLKIISFFLAVLIFAACNSEKGTTIEGAFQNAANLQVFLDKVVITNNNSDVIGKGNTDANGNFSINIPEGIQEGIYRLRIGQKAITLISDGKEKKVAIKADLNTLDGMNYEVKGSKDSEALIAAIKGLMQTNDVNTVKTTINNTQSPLVAMVLALSFSRGNPDFLDVHKSVSQKMKSAIPTSVYTTDYVNFVNQMEQQITMMQSQQTIQVGQPAPEISLKGPDGKTRSLSSLKGKVVLLDFWASWCGPCRRENPHVVDVYNRYKDKGFTVFSVSLDGLDNQAIERLNGDQAAIEQQIEASKQRWIAAIAQDKLTWDNHVSDLKKWNSAPAATYGIQSIPKTFLIGRDGNIVAVDPRNSLESELKKVL